MSIWRTGYGWKWPLFVAVWVPIVLLVVGGIVLAFVYRATWWEDHKTERGRGDAHVSRIAQDGEGDSAEVWAIEMPDDFSNFATRCVWEGWRGFTTTGDGGAFVVPDESCEMPEFVTPEEVQP